MSKTTARALSFPDPMLQMLQSLQSPHNFGWDAALKQWVRGPLPSLGELYLRTTNLSDDLAPTIVWVSAKDAAILKANESNNREIKEPRKRAYVKQQSLGDVPAGWRRAGMWENPIKIARRVNPNDVNEPMILLAGRHRIHALIDSGLPGMPFAVSFNATEEARLLQDANIARTKNDALAMFCTLPDLDLINSRTRNASAKILYFLGNVLKNGKSVDSAPNMREQSYSDTADSVGYYSAAYGEIDKTLVSKPQRGDSLTKSPVMAALILAHNRVSPVMFADWIRKLSAPGTITPGSALQTLIQVMNVERGDNNKSRWNQFLECCACLQAEATNSYHSLKVDPYVCPGATPLQQSDSHGNAIPYLPQSVIAWWDSKASIQRF